jgi:NAD(P)-dependent dehydrogenase (short-subunit alcohol dehydrogenase family)
LTKSTATQYAKDGIRCNSVHPGFIDTPMTERFLLGGGVRQASLSQPCFRAPSRDVPAAHAAVPCPRRSEESRQSR